MRKIPNRLDTAATQPLGDLNCAVSRKRQRRDIDGVLLEIRLQIFQREDLRALNGSADYFRIDVKKRFNLKPALCKILIICERLSEIPGAYDNQILLLVNSKQFPDFRMQMRHMIAVTLLSESAEGIQILAYL